MALPVLKTINFLVIPLNAARLLSFVQSADAILFGHKTVVVNYKIINRLHAIYLMSLAHMPYKNLEFIAVMFATKKKKP